MLVLAQKRSNFLYTILLRMRVLRMIDWIKRPWVLSFAAPSGHGLEIEGDPLAVSSSNPDWINQWGWVVLSVDEVPDGLYYPSGFAHRKFLRKVTKFIAVRVGPHNVTFFACSKGGKEIRLRPYIFPGPKERPFSREEIEKRLKARHVPLIVVTWA